MNTNEKLIAAVAALPLIMAPVVLADIYDLPKGVALLIIAVLLAATSMRRLSSSPAIRLGTFDLVLLALMAWLVVSTVFSINPMRSLTGFYRSREGLVAWFAYATIYFAASRTNISRSFTDRLISVFLALSIPVSLYAVWQRLGFDPLAFADADPTRSFSTVGNPVYLGTYLSLILPFAVIYLYEPGDWNRRILGMSAFGLGAAALLSSYTRAAWLTSIPALIFLVVWLIARSGKSRRSVIMAAIGLTVLTSGLFFSSGIADRLMSSFSTERGAAASRLETWRITPRIIRMRPVTGWGLETFHSAFVPARSKKFVELEGAGSSQRRPHNQTLYIGYAAGLPGLALYLMLIGYSITSLFARFRGADDRLKPFYLAALLSVGGYWLQEQFSFSLVGVTPVMWLILGVAAAEDKRPWAIRLPDLRPTARTLLAIIASLVVALAVMISIGLLYSDHLYRIALESRDPAQAAASLETAVRLNPMENTYRLALAQAYLSSGLTNAYPSNLQRAVTLAEQASARDPWDVMSHLVTADAIWAGYSNGITGSRSDLFRAEKAYRRAISLDPFRATVRLQLGLVYRELGRLDASKQELKQALRLDPKLIQAQTALDEIGRSERDHR